MALLALSQWGYAKTNEEGVEKKKTISKTYTVAANDKLQIKNSFGDVTINTWDKNEFKVDIEILVKAKTEQRAQYILDNIKVNEDRTANLVSFETNMHINGKKGEQHDSEDDSDNKGNNKNHQNGYENKEFHINYVVFMPNINALKIENSFGKTMVPDMKGMVNLTSKFGSLTAGNLANVEDIDVQFGKAQIGDIHNGKITFKFDDKSTVGQLSGSVKIVNDFSDLVQYNISNTIDELTINQSYSSLRLIVPKDFSANFTIHTNFGEFENLTDFKIGEKKEYGDDDNGIHFDKDYSGVSGDGKINVKIKSSFGEIKLAHTMASKEELQEEKMEKKQHKEKKEKKEKKEPKEVEES